jgi:hypothetical protein
MDARIRKIDGEGALPSAPSRRVEKRRGGRGFADELAPGEARSREREGRERDEAGGMREHPVGPADEDEAGRRLDLLG